MKDEFESRKETLEMIARKIQESQVQLPDIRERSWKNIDCIASNLLNLLIEAENILLKLDEYQMKNNHCYPEFEDFMLQISDLRAKYTAYIDNNIEILEIKNI